MAIEIEHESADAADRDKYDLAIRFQFVSRNAEAAAKAAPFGRRTSAYVKVMSNNGFDALDMDEVRRLVGD